MTKQIARDDTLSCRVENDIFKKNNTCIQLTNKQPNETTTNHIEIYGKQTAAL